MSEALIEEGVRAPSAMYTAILSQPRDIREVTSKNIHQFQALARRISKATTTTFVGIGSSLHAAQLGVALMRERAPFINVSAEHSYDTANGLGTLTPERVASDPSRHVVVVFSHRGTKRFSREALRRARELGVGTCLVTGDGVDVHPREVEIHITTVAQERSSAHTASLLGSLAVCAGVVEALDGASGLSITDAFAEAAEAGLELEREMEEVARQVPLETRHIWIVGSGSDAIVAREIALKIKETSFLPSEGMSVEEFLHGPFQCVEPSDLLVVIDTQSHGRERASVLLQMAACIGVRVIVLSDDLRADENAPTAKIIGLKSGPVRTLNSITALVSLQLFSCHLAVMRGEDPDGFRLHDPRFKRASDIVRL